MICPACRKEMDFNGHDKLLVTHRLWHHETCTVSEELAKEVFDKILEVRLLAPGLFK